MIFSRGDFALRPMRDDPQDYALLAGWLSDERVLEYYEGRDHPLSPEQAAETFNLVDLTAEGVTPAIMLYQGQPIGYMQFYPADLEEYRFEEQGTVYGLDLFIGEPDYWNRGLGTTFVRLLLDHLFDTLSADWAILDPHVDNVRAIRAYEKCGFQKVRLLPQHEWHEGRYVDCWLMAVRRPS
jgi:aminoglycoside 6'-N-acetyltransferase